MRVGWVGGVCVVVCCPAVVSGLRGTLFNLVSINQWECALGYE